MHDRSNSPRNVRILVGNFTVRLFFREEVIPEYLLLCRDLVNEAFQSAHSELFHRRNFFDHKVGCHTLVSRIERGSMDLVVLYQMLVSIPWADVISDSGDLIEKGLHLLKEIGSIASGIYAIKNCSSLIKKKLAQGRLPIDTDRKDSVVVQCEPTFEIIERPIESTQQTLYLRKRLFHDEKPFMVGTVVYNKESVEQILMVPQYDDLPKTHIGGQVLIHDLNLHLNGLIGLDDLKLGDLMFFNNFSALGLQYEDNPESVYISATENDPDIKVESVILDTYEGPSGQIVYRGREVDADNFDDFEDK